MTADRRNPATGARLDAVAGEAALIATFYGRRKSGPKVHEQLYRSLSRATEEVPIPDEWRDPDEQAFLHRFDPPSAHDTTVVQLALNAPDDAARAWESTREQLEKLVSEEGFDGGWWGYTLTYQAVLAPGVDPERGLSELLPSVQKLRLSEELHPLARAEVPGGDIWLLDVPTRGDGLEAATVYAALGPPQQEAALMGTVYGPGATLLMPDLIAHKGYHQMRQYRGGDLESRYEAGVGGLRETTERLLGALGQHTVESGQINELARKYHPLVSVASNLEELHVSLIRQSHNYARWQTRVGSNAVVEFHREQLDTATLELELRVKELRRALETADKSVSVAQVQVAEKQERAQLEIKQARERRQRRIDTAVAVVATALALPEMVDRQATRALLGLAGVEIPQPPPGQVEEPDEVLILLLTQGVVILAVALLFGLAVHLLSKKWRGRGE